MELFKMLKPLKHLKHLKRLKLLKHFFEMKEKGIFVPKYEE